MKKVICLMLLATFVTAIAIPMTAQSMEHGSTIITTTVGNEYNIVIPANLTIEFNRLSTSIGSIGANITRLESGKQLVVIPTYSGELINSSNSSCTIHYTLNSGGIVMTSAAFTATGTKALSIDITQAEWDQASAGTYSDTITFMTRLEAIP